MLPPGVHVTTRGIKTVAYACEVYYQTEGPEHMPRFFAGDISLQDSFVTICRLLVKTLLPGENLENYF